MNVRAHDGGRSLVDASQHAHRSDRAKITFRIQANDRIHPIATVLTFHHVRNVIHGGAPNRLVLVFDEGDQRVHGGRVTTDQGPPAQPEVIPRVRDGPGRRESLRKSCHA